MSFMLDTDMETQKKYYALLAKMTPEKRLEQGLRLSRMVREACIAAIQRQYPEYTWDDVRKEYLKRIMTKEEFETLYREGR